MLTGPLEDIRIALRSLRRAPAFAVAVILILALGIGLSTTVFGALYSVVVRPLPYADGERLVMLWQHDDVRPSGLMNLSHPALADLQRDSTAYELLAAFSYQEFTVDGNGLPERLTGLGVSPRLFESLGVQPARGRFWSTGELTSQEVIISDRLWRSRFGASPTLPGGTILLDGDPHTVVGIMPPGFTLPPAFTAVTDGVSRSVTGVDLWRPMGTSGVAGRREIRTLLAVGRLRTGVTVATAQTEASVLAERLAQAYPATERGLSLRVVPLRQQVSGSVRVALLALLTAVALVWLLVCANVANLLLMRAVRRHREMAIRAAVGATNGHLVRLMLAEGVWLTAGGGLLGLLLARWTMELIAGIGLVQVPRLGELSLYREVAAFGIGVSLLSGLLFSLAPAWRAARPGLHGVLKGEGYGITGTRRTRLAQRALASAQLSACVVVMVGAGLMLRTMAELTRVDPGFDTTRTLTAQLFVAPTVARSEPARVAIVDRLMERLAALPGVAAVGAVSTAPLGARGENTTSIIVDDAGAGLDGPLEARQRPASPGYFAAMGIGLRGGRTFATSDRADGPPVAIVNESFARTAWPGRAAVGQRLRPDRDTSWHTVVGVIGDVRHDGPASTPQPEVYVPYAQQPGRSFTVVLRTVGNPALLTEAVRLAVREVHPALPVTRMRTMDEAVAATLSTTRLTTTMLVAFALFGIVLAVVGVYATVSQSVLHRTREFGIRLSLGAHRREIRRLVLHQEFLPMLLGLVVGVAGALALGRLMRNLLYGVSGTDTLTLLVVPVLLGATALAACLMTAEHAAGVDPLTALRSE
jgi:predicted permease